MDRHGPDALHQAALPVERGSAGTQGAEVQCAMRSNLANLISFQVLWFVCVLGAASGHDLVGVAAVAVFLPLHLWLIAERRAEM
ncbi:DUF2878 family protein, partial [Candidatus Sumerlaeota bacterium]|nr:DUF2878 family protein [Candidatus Sumerlaeota bacterium]